VHAALQCHIPDGFSRVFARAIVCSSQQWQWQLFNASSLQLLLPAVLLRFLRHMYQQVSALG
jgi:hypothetical protein